MADLKAWLQTHGLGQYSQVLVENDVDLETLPHLSDADLAALGFSLGHRRKLIAALAVVERDEAAETAPEAPEDRAERRQLTVLFCDLAGSTELSERLDPEELRTVMGRYQDMVAAAVAAHDGHVAKFLGDGVLAFFGWPRAHEDDAERAILAALDAVAATGQIVAGGDSLAARAGIATGPVVVGDRAGPVARESDAVSGATPNLAARLQSLADPGEVVIAAVTRRLVGAAFDLEARGSHSLKGIAGPVGVWRVLRPAKISSRFDAQHGGRLTELVGRSHEIGLLQDRWRLAEQGEGQVVLLSGEAGIGKSRILREFAARLHPRICRCLRFQCSPHETNAAFYPMIAELQASAGFEVAQSADERLDRLERHLDQVFGSRAGSALPLLAVLCGLPEDRFPQIEMGPQRRKQQTVTMLTERIAELAGLQPVVMLVEDIHWIDPSSLETLDAIVGRIADLPVLAVMTHRPEFHHRWGGLGHLTAHSLNRLGRSDGRAIAERVAGGKPLPDIVLARIVEQTDGIPLFVEELTKTVLEAGVLTEHADRFELSGPLPVLAIPETLHDSLMARLDRLAPVKRVVQAAACIGREFGTGLLSAALPMAAAELNDALDQLINAELIFRQGGIGEDARYIFKHALVQDAAYASLLTTARHDLHERLALALQETPGPDPLELARHFFEAGQNAQAVRLYLQAGKRALDASALSEAIGALELGLNAADRMEPSPERDRLQLDTRVALGTARMANFGWAHPSVADAMEPAFPLAKELGDQDALGSILWGLWVHYQTRTNFPQAHQWLEQLEALAKANDQTDLPVIFDMSAGCQSFWEADYTRAIEHTDHLKKIYEPERHARIAAVTNHDPLVFSQHWAGSLAEWIRGYPDRALERLNEAIPLARKVGHPFNLMFALTAGSTALIYLNQTAQMLSFCDEAEKVVTDEVLGPFALNVCVYQWRGAAHILAGDFELGLDFCKPGNEFWEVSGGGVCTAMMRSWIVLGLLGLGRVEDARVMNSGNIAHCRSTGDRYMEPECLRLQGEISLLADPKKTDAAERYFRDAISLAQAHGARSWELRASLSLARLLVANDRHTEATAFLEPVLQSFNEGFGTADLIAACALVESLG